MKVTLIDYGIGNLYSVSRALEYCGAEVTLSSDPSTIEASPRLVLPGVGAFADGMSGLRERGLIEPIRRYAATGRPLLGICLGMQMLTSASEEFGRHEGLGLIPGNVVPIPTVTTQGQPHKTPNIGWSALTPAADADWSGTLLARTEPGTFVYLVHSYHVVPDDPKAKIATCEYGGHAITTAIRSGAVHGFQFHPEKSGEEGLRMLEVFLHENT
ncbi:imidazole glycerol phosphate synthase subunit HisH [Pandoraea sp. CB10b_02]|uniref:imidazole glycerol phosphate synthase subunit HisH n=1 Tax=Pandoraea sp. CB10b_02 TaxID=2014535 RepID=UPI00257DB6E2|nr:imidazole glycerol phosphate synthase subunit HisH [Pandoraea sp. CB10b_02]